MWGRINAIHTHTHTHTHMHTHTHTHLQIAQVRQSREVFGFLSKQHVIDCLRLGLVVGLGVGVGGIGERVIVGV